MAQKGFEYENNAYKALQKYNISTGGTAGASHDKPDLTIQRGKKTSGVELKNKPTAAGSLVLQYDAGTQKWNFGPTDGNPEKEFLKSVGEGVKIIDRLNKEWKNPALRYVDGKKTFQGFSNYKRAYAYDLTTFGNMYVDVPNKTIADYYNSKSCYYLNVGSHGLFLLNSSDPLKLNSALKEAKLQAIPNFSSATSATTQIRVRVQDKSGSYQFAFTLQFKGVSKSPYNLAPLRSGSTHLIDTTTLSKNPILRIF